VKLLSPSQKLRFYCTSAAEYVASFWVNNNTLIVKTFSPTKIEFVGAESVVSGNSYLIISNHKSWLDTLVLQLAFHNKVSFPKFFMKSQMFFVPFIGLACWVLEFPAMKRYSKEYLSKHPEKKGQDIAKTREYCQKLSVRPTSIVNFVEGTRFNELKAQKSSYDNLLNPKAGGIAVILNSLSDRMVGVLNTTIVYDDSGYSLWDFMIRKIRNIKVNVEFIPMKDIPIGNYFDSENDKKEFQQWLNKLWDKKDKYISKEIREV
jgi:1-acyl-sn-glycerol-3-phosphate acyltransferase